MKIKNDELKTFSDHLVKKDTTTRTDAGEINDGKVNIASDATDSEAFSTALLQNTALALTDPYLAPDGTYPIVAIPNNKTPLWKIIFSKEGNDWMYAYWAHPVVHEEFMAEVKRSHDSYEHFKDSNSSLTEYLGPEIRMPPYIAQAVEFNTGFEFGSEPFKQFVANDEELQYFWINKDSIGRYWKK